MKHLRALTALGLLGAAGAVHAQVTATVTATSDYDFRGISQTTRDPALQASVDWANEAGVYLGAWGSNVDFGPGTDSDVELDLYGGYRFSVGEDFKWDVGAVYYTYWPDDDNVEYPEIYAGLGYKIFGTKLWYSWDFGNTGKSAYYLEGNFTFPLPADFSLTAHAGYSGGDYWDDLAEKYFDYAVGVSKAFGKFSASLKYIDGSDLKSANGTPGDVFTSEDKVVLSVSTTFPWSK